MAGDAQMDPSDLPRLLDPLVKGEVDYSKGNRLFTGKAWRIIPKARYFGNAILSFLTKIASGYWHVADSQSGYTAVALKVLKTLDLDGIYKRYGMPNDLLVKLNVFQFRVRDIPINPIYGVGERSYMKIYKVIFTLSFLLFKLFLWRLKEEICHPGLPSPSSFFTCWVSFSRRSGSFSGLSSLLQVLCRDGSAPPAPFLPPFLQSPVSNLSFSPCGSIWIIIKS